jgi:hypothetical protein
MFHVIDLRLPSNICLQDESEVTDLLLLVLIW